jgi:SAM-dependent methyltransferase
MDRHQHWNSIYQTTPVTDVSWFESEPHVSLELIKAVAPTGCSVIDIGGGASRLVDSLLAAGYDSLTVLDISATALERAKARLGSDADRVTWLVANITKAETLGNFDLWHDRAVFHFLTTPEDRQTYVNLASRTVRVGGHLIVGTFALDGPEKCSGLDVCRYDSARLSGELGPRFKLLRENSHTHVTPTGKQQQFIFCLFEHSPQAAPSSESARSRSTK